MSLVVLFGCTNTVLSEIKDYNSNFTDSDSIPAEPGEPDFHSGQLFSVDEYFLYDDSILILSAPKSTHSIKWVFTDPDNKYEVVTVDGGFNFNGKLYKTLSAVANIITGTHWNGKKFFGVCK